MERLGRWRGETVEECNPVWLMLTLPLWLVNGMKRCRWNITFKAFKVLMLTDLFFCCFVLLHRWVLCFNILAVLSSRVESSDNQRISWNLRVLLVDECTKHMIHPCHHFQTVRMKHSDKHNIYQVKLQFFPAAASLRCGNSYPHVQQKPIRGTFH